MLKSQFNAVEVLEMAKDIEKRGYDFYIKQAKKTDNSDLSGLFNKLAEDELDHFRRFEGLIEMVNQETVKRADYVYDQEVSAYLQAIVEFSIFPKDDEIEVESVEKAIKMAITAEKDSILFYQEMLEYNQGEAAQVIEQLIKEEKQHLLELVKYNDELQQ